MTTWKNEHKIILWNHPDNKYVDPRIKKKYFTSKSINDYLVL